MSTPAATTAAGPPPPVFLPRPRIPSSAALPTAAEVSDVVGVELAAPLTEYERHHREVVAAVNAIEDHRPGGVHWAEALAADSKHALEHQDGRSPRGGWRTERLLAEDGGRWARASAMARTLAARRREVMDSLDLEAIAQTANGIADEAVAVVGAEAMAGWAARDNLAEAWRRREAADEAARRLTMAVAIRNWAQVGQWHSPGRMRRTGQVSPATCWPASPTARSRTTGNGCTDVPAAPSWHCGRSSMGPSG